MSPVQVKISNPSVQCGLASTTLTTSTAALPGGWTLRTCVPIVVFVAAGSSCSTSDAVKTTWKLNKATDPTAKVASGVGAGTTTVQYCGGVSEQLQFTIVDSDGAWTPGVSRGCRMTYVLTVPHDLERSTSTAYC
jgi:hypothetical protein